MGMFDHWHPVLPSKKLRRRPVGIRLAGKDIALFRARSGQVGALDDQCPHRRMRLSAGKVVGDRLMCGYHGWTFDCDGNGESPGTPKLHACASSFDAREEYGYVWVKSKESCPVFPKFDIDDWFHIGNTDHRAQAPLELVVDNFCEIEHTPMVHEFFGYELDGMKDVTVHCEATDDATMVVNHGPPKPINFFLRYLIGIKKGFIFNDTWTTFFSPVYSVYDHMWMDPKTGEEAWVRWRVYVFFVPVADKETRVAAFAYAKSKWPVPPHGGLLAFRGFMRRRVVRELKYDVGMLSNLASYDTSIEGMKLSRFDKVMGLNRERIDRIYRGNKAPEPQRTLKIAAGE